jgi:hypothetical protein
MWLSAMWMADHLASSSASVRSSLPLAMFHTARPKDGAAPAETSTSWSTTCVAPAAHEKNLRARALSRQLPQPPLRHESRRALFLGGRVQSDDAAALRVERELGLGARAKAAHDLRGGAVSALR